MVNLQTTLLGLLAVPVVWMMSAVASHAWHTVKFNMIKRLGPPRP